VNFEFDWSGAQKEFQRALELNPNSAEAHYFYSLAWLTPSGKHEQAIAEIRQTLALDPLSLPHNQGAAYIFYYARQYPEAVEQCKKTIALDPNFATGHARLSEVYAQLGRYEDSIAESEKAASLAGFDPAEVSRWHASLRLALATAGGRGYWQDVADELKRHDSFYGAAAAYARLGQKQEAFLWLEKAVRAKDNDLIYLGVDPALDSVHSDRRYVAFMQRIGLPAH